MSIKKTEITEERVGNYVMRQQKQGRNAPGI
jgi:hypothetical protein